MVGGGLLVSFTILARDQPSRAPIDSTKIQLRLEVIQNTQLPQLVPFFFVRLFWCATENFPRETWFQDEKREAKKKVCDYCIRPLCSMYADVASRVNKTL